MLLKGQKPSYQTVHGSTYCGDSLKLLDCLPEGSVDLVVTSPPFALLREKEYGNRPQDQYVDWLLKFTDKIHRVLKDTGSLVIDLGGAYERGKPTRSLHNYRFLIRAVDEQGYRLAQDFFWFNSSKLPSPIEWVNKRKIRAKDSVNTIFWFSKTDNPKADITKVLVPYSARMLELLKDSDKFYSPKLRPSGHDISGGFAKDNGGALPSSLLQIPNTESNSKYLAICSKLGLKGHPARFPKKLPEFFIKMLTAPADLVVDIFAGSNTTGEAAEGLGRKWLSFELDPEYVAASSFRFLEKDLGADALKEFYLRILNGKQQGKLLSRQSNIFEEQQAI